MGCKKGVSLLLDGGEVLYVLCRETGSEAGTGEAGSHFSAQFLADELLKDKRSGGNVGRQNLRLAKRLLN